MINFITSCTHACNAKVPIETVRELGGGIKESSGRGELKCDIVDTL
jgi:hypothetical protein